MRLWRTVAENHTICRKHCPFVQTHATLRRKLCTYPPRTHNSIVGKSANGAAYRTRAAQSHPSGMNAALAKALIALLPSAAALRDAGGE
eukprot:789219-Pleurochrysis_carterae.AAC.5